MNQFLEAVKEAAAFSFLVLVFIEIVYVAARLSEWCERRSRSK